MDFIEILFNLTVVKGQVEDNQRNLYMNWALDSINTLLLMLLCAEGIAVMISNAIINLNMVDWWRIFF